MSRYLTELEPRPYQTDATAWAVGRDEAVVCLPTGTGKTLVGCLWMCQVLDEDATDRVLVLEPSRFLVEQVHAYVREETTLDTAKLYGTTAPAARLSQWDDGEVMVTTPQTAVNDIGALDFDAVVIDECHHTTGQHAFAQLMRGYEFPRKLGLSATIPGRKSGEIERLIGDIRRRTWQDLPAEHVPDWFGEVYDAPYPDAYRDAVERLEQFRLEFDGSPLAGLPTLGVRMLARDGALALTETLEADTKMGTLMGGELLPILEECEDLHKLAACRAALADHEFEKAVLFVDRVAVAKRLSRELTEHQTVTIVGRLHSDTAGQQKALQRARADATDLIIATAAGEEGIDLPKADLLIVWSNIVNSVRFIQRLGRVMRTTESDRPKAAIYLATPDSPDYESLHRGIARAKAAGLDIVGIDEDVIFSRSIVNRVVDTLEGRPSQIKDLCDILSKPESTVDNWLGKTVREGDVCYLYSVPDDLNDWRNATKGITKMLGGDVDPERLRESSGGPFSGGLRNNFSPGKSDRYYLTCGDISLIRSEYPFLFDATTEARLSVTYGPTHQQISKYSTSGSVDTVREAIETTLDGESQFYANISHKSRSPKFTFQMQYQGVASSEVLRAVCENANAIVTTVQDRLN